jgi:hypothetical protein
LNLLARSLDNLDILPGQVAEPRIVAIRHCFRFNQLAADAETARARFEKVGGSVQIDARSASNEFAEADRIA